MRYQPIPPELFVEHRRRFAEQLPPGALCVIHANDVAHTNGDGTRSFIQNSNLFWLTGIDQEETILLLYPDSPAPEFREVLFIRQTNAHLAIWEGPKLSRENATEISGIQQVKWTTAFEGLLKKFMTEIETVFLLSEHHPNGSLDLETRNQRFAGWCRRSFPCISITMQLPSSIHCA